MTLDQVIDRCVILEDGCIRWRGAHDGKGYAHFRPQGLWRTDRVFRTFYELLHGVIPPWKELHHTCHNKWCVSPFHIEVVDRIGHMEIDKRMTTRDELGRFKGGGA